MGTFLYLLERYIYLAARLRACYVFPNHKRRPQLPTDLRAPTAQDQTASYHMLQPDRWANRPSRTTSTATASDDGIAANSPAQPGTGIPLHRLSHRSYVTARSNFTDASSEPPPLISSRRRSQEMGEPIQEVTTADLADPQRPPEVSSSADRDEERTIGEMQLPDPEDVPRPEGSDQASSLRRELQRIHIFMISLSACIGMGFYVRTGGIEAIGGPSAVLFAYGLLGLLALAVMQCLATMLRIWPIRGALMTFVQEFVDEEVGIMVGWLYWLTYCFSFAGLTTTIGVLADDLHVGRGGSIVITICSLLLPILANLTDIRIFKKIEIFFGTVKLLIVVVITLTMMIINSDVAHTHVNAPEKREVVFRGAGPLGWFGTLLAAMFYASFSFVGIEAVAATAMEADFRSHSLTSGHETDGMSDEFERREKNPFWKPAMLVPAISTLSYMCAGWIVTENIAWDDDRLIQNSENFKASASPSSASLFVNSALDKSPRLAKAVIALLIINVASTSSTALYIASRSLFGMALIFSGHLHNGAERDNMSRVVRAFKIVVWTNRFKVPWVAVLASAGWPCIIPFFKYISPAVFSSAIDLVVEMGSVSCVLVWGCICFAAGRLYRNYKRNDTFYTRPMREYLRVHNKLWYRLQTSLAFTAASFCFSIVLFGGTMAYYHNKSPVQAIAAFSVFGFFFLGALALKTWRKRSFRFWQWRLTDLGKNNLPQITDDLEKHLKNNGHNLSAPTLTRNDLFGIVDSEVIRQRLTRDRK